MPPLKVLEFDKNLWFSHDRQRELSFKSSFSLETIKYSLQIFEGLNTL